MATRSVANESCSYQARYGAVGAKREGEDRMVAPQTMQPPAITGLVHSSCSSVVEHSLGKGEATRSIRVKSTIFAGVMRQFAIRL